MSFIASCYVCRCYVCFITTNYGDLLCFLFICCNHSFLYFSYTKLFLLCGLKGICCVTILGIVTIGCFIFLRIYFWGLTSSLDFLFNSNPFPISTCSFFPHDLWKSPWCSSPITHNMLGESMKLRATKCVDNP